jgi:hypothetical protein
MAVIIGNFHGGDGGRPDKAIDQVEALFWRDILPRLPFH